MRRYEGANVNPVTFPPSYLPTSLPFNERIAHSASTVSTGIAKVDRSSTEGANQEISTLAISALKKAPQRTSLDALPLHPSEQSFFIKPFKSDLPKQPHSAPPYIFLTVITVNSTQSTKDRPPKHVAIIMDGNGRWAKERGLPRIEGHRRGAEAVKRTLKAAQENGVEIITLYAFSVENWNRPKVEVDALMSLLDRFLVDQLPVLIKRKIRLRVVGRYKELPEYIQHRLRKSEAATAQFTEHTLALALNYGARTEVVDAIKAIAQAAQAGSIDPNTLDYDSLRPYLYTNDLPDPDLVIRTSGEARLSNFLLLQAAYAEIYFTSVLWPDFDESHFKAALADYASRERRYGKTAEQLQVS